MSWETKYRPASFRGVSFNVLASDASAGRRSVIHEYPQRDEPWAEDMGRAKREFQLEAIVIGSDYMTQRDALIKALQQPGSGQLVHPYFGTWQVSVAAPARIRESTAEGGMATFIIHFVESGKQKEPGSSIDSANLMDEHFNNVTEKIIQDFSGFFSVKNVLDFVVDDAVKNVSSLLEMDVMQQALGNQDLIRASPKSVKTALLPENILASLADTLTLGAGIVSLISVTETSKKTLLEYALPELPTSTYTLSRQRQRENRTALENLVVHTAASKEIVDLSVSEPMTLDEAEAISEEIVSMADLVIMKASTGYATIEAVTQLRTVAIEHFLARTADLPKAITLKSQVTLPATVLAHRFYGDDWYERERDSEIVQRNRIRHPGYVPAGRSIQLISE